MENWYRGSAFWWNCKSLGATQLSKEKVNESFAQLILIQCLQIFIRREVLAKFEYQDGGKLLKRELFSRCHTSYLSPIPPIYLWRKICYMEKIQISNVTDVEKSEVSPHVEKFQILHMCLMWRMFPHLCCFIIKLVLSRFVHFCVEKSWSKNCICGEKWQIWGMATAVSNMIG